VFRLRTLLIAATASVAAALAAVGPRHVEVVGTSMTPTLDAGDRLLVVRTRRPRAGDVAVVPDPRDPSRLVVKRVVDTSPVGVILRGDNPDASTDSRTFGPAPRSTVRGRAVYRYYPAARRGRIGRLLP
jgi:nickel-type superoxide dismutase maturation protease